MLIFGGVSPMTTTTLSLFHMLCMKLSQEFTVKTNINDCCREVLQHHRSQLWFWMQTSTQNPQRRQKETAGIRFKKVKQNHLIFRSLPQLSIEKNLLIAISCGALRRVSVVSGIPIVGFLSMVQLGAVPVPGEAICALENKKTWYWLGWLRFQWGLKKKVIPIKESGVVVISYIYRYTLL